MTLSRLVKFSLCLTLVVIMLGAYTRLADAGFQGMSRLVLVAMVSYLYPKLKLKLLRQMLCFRSEQWSKEKRG